MDVGLFDQDLLKHTTRIYGVNWTIFDKNHSKTICIKWILEDEYGKKYFLKEKPYYLNNEEFKNTIEFHSILRSKGIHTPYILKNKSENRIFKFANRMFVIYEWVEGNTLSPKNSNDLTALGMQLAIFHKLKLNKQGSWNSPLCRYLHFLDIRKKDMNEIFKILNSFGPDDAELSTLINELQRWISFNEKTIDWDKLEKSWLHGDPHLFNFIKKINGEMVFIDLDDMHWGYRLSDLIWAITICCIWDWDTVNANPIIRESINSEVLSKIIDSYEQVSGLNEMEKKAIPYFLVAMIIKSVVCIKGLIRNSKNLASKDVIYYLQRVKLLVNDIEVKFNVTS
ncbi:phosphotransferase [Bacillus cereus]|nr:phosphotransferase [Bacillus cereus]